jgi:YD repeat-containing protein
MNSAYSSIPFTVLPGDLSDKPVWRGHFAANGEPLEHTRYLYRQDGELIFEQDCSAGWADTNDPLVTEFYPGFPMRRLLRTRTRNPDISRRPTEQRLGNIGVPGILQLAQFDANSNQTALGAGYNLIDSTINGNPPLFCQSGGATSIACHRFVYDRLNRLTGFEQAWGGSNTCFDYDARGNISRVSLGCSPGSCATNSITSVSVGAGGNMIVTGGSTCSASKLEYVWDDFGNLASYSMQVLSTTAETRYVYDALGNAVSKQTAQQRSAGGITSYDFDLLGRPTLAVETAGASSSTLFERIWDTAPAMLAGCFSGALGNTKGRVAYESAPVWRTWFGYDADGRLVDEVRVKQGITSCSGNLDTSTNRTSYSYSPSGKRTGIRYPFGRNVSYAYATGDRITQINVQIFLSPPGSIFVPMITNIKWEGERVKSYLLHHYNVMPQAGVPLQPSNLQTEITYAYSTSDTEQYTTCFTDSTGADGTGRLRRIKARSIQYGWVYDRILTWKADQIDSIDVCYFGQSTPINEFRATRLANGLPQNSPRAYDGLGQLRYGFGTAGFDYTTHEWTYEVDPEDWTSRVDMF